MKTDIFKASNHIGDNGKLGLREIYHPNYYGASILGEMYGARDMALLRGN